MTDRYAGFYVVLEHDLREDDAASTIEAIRHIKGVLSVEPKINHTMEEIVARSRLMNRFQEGVYDLLGKLRELK